MLQPSHTNNKERIQSSPKPTLITLQARYKTLLRKHAEIEQAFKDLDLMIALDLRLNPFGLDYERIRWEDHICKLGKEFMEVRKELREVERRLLITTMAVVATGKELPMEIVGMITGELDDDGTAKTGDEGGLFDGSEWSEVL